MTASHSSFNEVPSTSLQVCVCVCLCVSVCVLVDKDTMAFSDWFCELHYKRSWATQGWFQPKKGVMCSHSLILATPPLQSHGIHQVKNSMLNKTLKTMLAVHFIVLSNFSQPNQLRRKLGVLVLQHPHLHPRPPLATQQFCANHCLGTNGQMNLTCNMCNCPSTVLLQKKSYTVHKHTITSLMTSRSIQI